MAVKGKDCVIHAVSTINPGNSNESYMRGYQRGFYTDSKIVSYTGTEPDKINLFIFRRNSIWKSGTSTCERKCFALSYKPLWKYKIKYRKYDAYI